MPVDFTKGIPATSMQRSMLLASARGGSPPPYHIQFAMELNDTVDLAALREAWRLAIQKHSILMASFQFQGPRLLVSHNPNGGFPWREVAIEDGGHLAGILHDEHNIPFRTESHEPLWRVLVIHQKTGPRVVSFTRHHAVYDWYSGEVFLPDLFKIHDDICEGRQPATSNGTNFFDYLQWQRDRSWTVEEQYWRIKFQGVTESPGLAVVVGSESAEGCGESVVRLPVDLPPGIDAPLRAMARQHNSSLNFVLLAAWGLWLARSSGEDYAIMGVMRACRASAFEGARQIVGPLLNTLPLVLRMTPGITVKQWLDCVRTEWRALRNVEHSPLDKVFEWSGLPEGISLFHSSVNFLPTTFDDSFETMGLGKYGRQIFQRREVDLPFVVSGFEKPEFTVNIAYRPDRVSSEYAVRAGKSLAAILEQFADSSQNLLDNVSLLSSEEHRRVLRFAMGPPHHWPDVSSVLSMFHSVTKNHPDAPALIEESAAIFYEELDRLSTTVAGNLASRHVGRGDVVAVMMKSNPKLIAIMLGILKTGAAFFLINPDLPEDSRRALMHDAGTSHFVTADQAASLFDPCAPSVLDSLPMLESIDTRSLAYLVHTSGSTGRMKVIEVEHRSLSNFLLGIIPIYELKPGDRRIQRAQPGSDYFIAEILANLCAGSAIVFHNQAAPVGISEFLRMIRDHGITVTGIPASYWHEWVRALDNGHAPDLPPSLRLVITGMEKVEIEALRRWRTIIGDRVKWLNIYGPTEATIVASAYSPATSLPPWLKQLPIGKPLSNYQVHVLDHALRLLPPGMVGEICVGGVGVMRGYRVAGRTDASMLVQNPYSTDENSALLYKAGDFGFYLEDGNLVFLGRRDRQVKLHGHRVELDAVESAVSRATGGCNCVALLCGEPGTAERLVAFIESDKALNESLVKESAKEWLHPSTVPSRIICMASLPRLANGKLDRQSLLMQFDALIHESEAGLPACEDTDAPSGNAMTKILSIFRQVLRQPGLGPDDNFFDAGGDSLSAVRVTSGIEEALAWYPALRDVYAAGTARGLANLHSNSGATSRGVVHCNLLGGGATKSARHHVLIIPPISGIYRRLHSLAGHWRSRIPLWSLEQEPPEPDPVNYSVERLARNYADKVLEEFQGKSVTLVGYSSGALMAWQMGVILADSRVHVRQVVLLEPTTFGGDRSAAMESPMVRRSLFQKLLYFQRFARVLAFHERFAFFAALLRRSVAFRLGERPNPPPGLDPKSLSYRNRACREYEPPQFHGRVLLLRNVDRKVGGRSSAHEKFWKQRCGDVRVHDVPVGHRQILEEPEVRLTARILERLVARR